MQFHHAITLRVTLRITGHFFFLVYIPKVVTNALISIWSFIWFAYYLPNYSFSNRNK
ncbi:hypothetical protein RhiirA1_177416 [Rhizophagus irregularis]|uniref:Uncharacterized protein n=1 Tax=Rhizophagus irregularis TaxID=588596 RepID=A0A2N0RU27_9GLOM|nr:hypothetical protein RhiirA1_177416 [Rhizophagus irregularis]